MQDFSSFLQSQNKHIWGLKSLSGLADLILKTRVLDPWAHLVVAKEKELETLHSFFKLRQPDKKIFFLPQLTTSSLSSLKRSTWQQAANHGPAIFLAHPRSLLKKCSIDTKGVSIKKGSLRPKLSSLGYKQKDRAERVGDYSLQGLYLDIFTPLELIRLEMLGDTVETCVKLCKKTKQRVSEIHSCFIPSLLETNLNKEDIFKLLTHLKQQGLKVKEARQLSKGMIPEGFEVLLHALSLSCSLDFFKNKPLVWIYDTDELRDELSVKEYGTSQLFCFENIYLPFERLENENKIFLHKKKQDSIWSYPCYPVKKNLDTVKDLPLNHFIWLGSEQKIREFLKKKQDEKLIEKSIFIDSTIKESFVNLTEETAYLRAQDFIPSQNLKSSFDFFQNKFSALNFSELKEGDLVVHRKYGIARFIKLSTIKVENQVQDFIVLQYKDDNKLFVPAYLANTIKRYSFRSLSKKNVENLLDRLGDPRRWNKQKACTKQHIDTLVVELIRMYKEKPLIKRPSFEEKKEELLQFESQFPFKATAAQKRALKEIMDDMSKDRPMDRLLIADVGFGKTEVALRACFRALVQNKQVCFLVPTTVLALQHEEAFKKRFQNFPYKISTLTRFVPPKKKGVLFEELQNGSVNFLIATHGIFNSHIEFSNLGLLIIDEEHKFGVAQKEKLKKFKKNLDILSLSATPIPRTLNQSLQKMKDISIIDEPPPERKPITTLSLKREDNLIKQACDKEKQRGGQILFIHNRVASLAATTHWLREILPGYRIAMLSGQSSSIDIEKTLFDFLRKKYDLLVSTNIVESGMDIPNVNSLFIDRIQDMGLSQVHQLRGRIGRRDKQAFCYFLKPKKQLSKRAQERLQILEENSDLGSGFSVALHDMELRGAGSIFGKEQTGHFKAVGEELYFDLLEESLSEKNLSYRKREIEIKLPFGICLPSSYIEDPHLKLLYYKTFSQAETLEELQILKEDLELSFGPFPEDLKNLFYLLELKIQALPLLIKELNVTESSMTVIFYHESKIHSDKILSLAKEKNWKLISEYGIKMPLQTKNLKQEVINTLLTLSSSIG